MPAVTWETLFPSPEARQAWVTQRRQRACLYADPSPDVIGVLRQRWPERCESTRQVADVVCSHVFDLLGSGPVPIVDPDRPAGSDGYVPIDWAVDPIAGLRFPTGFPHKTWNPSMRPGLADIKWPWEIGRCQHA